MFDSAQYPFLLVDITSSLGQIVALFAMSVFIAYVCFRLRLVPIVGFLLAGSLIGPSAFRLVSDPDLINSVAEIGVILLLFTIGAEYSLEKLSRIGRAILIGGGLQVALSIAGTAVVLAAFDVEWRPALFTGGLVALSSTAIVLNLMSDRGETETPAGQLSLAVLIFQDLAVVVMVLLLPLLGGEGVSIWILIRSLATALFIIVGVLVLARKTVPWLLEKVADTRRQELFLLAVVAICFGTAYLTSLAGVSLALGAFLAGLVVSESRYSDIALSEILPLRTVFNAVFFVSIGMLLDLGFVVKNLPLVVAVAGAVLVLKAITTASSVVVLGYPIRTAAAVGLALAQIGEFSFVLEHTGEAYGLYPAGLGDAGGQVFIAVTVVLMMLTPLLVAGAPRVGAALEKTPLGRIGRRTRPATPAAVPVEDHVIVIGYGPAGERLVQVLRNTGIPFVVLELNPRLATRAEAEGVSVLRGDASRPHMLEMAGVERAKVCVVAINDRAATDRAVHMVQYLNPTVQLIVRARFLSDVEPLQRAGADIVVPEEMETSVRIFTHVLGAYLISPDEINQHVNAIRSGDYRVFRGSMREAHLMVLQGLDEEGLHTRAVAVRNEAPVAGKTLAELELRQQHGLSVLAVRRNGHTIGNPAGDFRVEAGDRLVMVGTADHFASSAQLFRDKGPDFS